MACERYREALTERAAGAPASAGLEAHLEECEGCRQELAALRHGLEAVDADLRQLLAAEPSPALAARIRRAAAETDAGSGWRPAFALQALAAAAAVAAVTFVLLRGHETAPAPVVAPRPLASGTPLPAPSAPPAPAAAPLATSASPVEVRVPSTAAARRAVPPEPEVLVPPGQLEALLRLAALVNRQRVAPPGMGAAGQASPDLVEPAAIDIRPLDIKPLEIVPLDAAETSGT